MKTLFARSPWDRESVMPLHGIRLGQSFSWNTSAGTVGGGFNQAPGLTPEQRLLQQAQESMNAPAPLTPEQRLLQQAQQSMNAPQCFTCTKEGDIKPGVDAAMAASLRMQGYLCRKDECAQNTAYTPPSYGNFGGSTYGGPQYLGQVRLVIR